MRVDRPMTGRSLLRQSISGQRRFVVGASVLAASHQGCEALVPVVIGVLIDDAVATGSVSTLAAWLGALAVLFLVLSTSFRFADRAAERASEEAAHDLRLRVTRRVLDPGGGADTGRLPGALVNIATGDVKRVGTAVMALPFGVAALTALVVSAVVLLRTSVPLGLLILVGTPPVLWLTHLVGKPLERRSSGEQDRAAHASGVAADLIAGLRVLKGIRAEAAAVHRYRRTSQASRAAAVHATRAHGWHDGAVVTVTGAFLALVALLGSYLALRGSISVGELVAAVGLAQFLMTPFHLITWVNGELAQGRASAGRIADVLAALPAVTSGSNRISEPVRGHLRLSGITQGALRDVGLDVPAGSLVGVAVTDPAAAADLLAVLARDTDPQRGSIDVDGTPLAAMDISETRRVVVVAAHDADLFEDTLLDNITAERTDITDRALAAATVDDVAETLPDGVHTVLGERGRSLSGGQRQRVALARALATNSPVLVVHDPTTAVDPVTEARIAAGITEAREGRTTVLVTTSPALLAATDTVYLLDHGTIADQGTHSDLVRDNARYREAVLA